MAPFGRRDQRPASGRNGRGRGLLWSLTPDASRWDLSRSAVAVAGLFALAVAVAAPVGSSGTDDTPTPPRILPTMHLRGLDPGTPKGRTAAARLADAVVIWLTTVRPDGQPQASPVWFVLDDGDFLVYSLAGTPRTRNIAAEPKVSLNLDSDAGSALVIVEGTARIIDGPRSVDHAAYQEKYRGHIGRIGHTPASFAARYPVAIRITPERWRIH